MISNLQRRRAPGLVALVAVLLVAAGTAGAESTTWHAETLTSSPRGLIVTQYWAKGSDRMRAETVVGGHRLITIVNGKNYYAVDATEGRVIAIERSPRAMANAKKRSRLIGLEGFVIAERGGEKVKSERLAGRMCDVLKHTDASGRQQVWVQQDDSGERLPMRVEVYNRKAAALIRTDYVQWIEGVVTPERLFLPDPRFEIENLDYESYIERAGQGLAMVPILHANLLHGDKN